MHFCNYFLYCSLVLILIQSKTVSSKKATEKIYNTTPEVIFELTRTLQDQNNVDKNENVVISPLGATLALAQINQLSCCKLKKLIREFMKWDDIGTYLF